MGEEVHDGIYADRLRVIVSGLFCRFCRFFYFELFFSLLSCISIQASNELLVMSRVWLIG